MGNNPSQSLAAAGAKSQFNSAVADVQSSLGMGDKKDEVVVPKHIGCANKKEQKQRHIDRQQEYEAKQRERIERKEVLESKWTASKSGTAAGIGADAAAITDEEKDKELKAKIAAMKEQSTLKDKKTKKKGLFGK